MAGVAADNVHDAAPADDLALVANSFDAGLYLHHAYLIEQPPILGKRCNIAG
jgi:hypothetical protein